MTIEEYRAFVDRLPKAAHEMEHVTNLGKIIARGFELLASEIRRSHEPVDHEAINAKRDAARKAKRDQLRREPRPFPTLRIKRAVSDIDQFQFEDFELLDYAPHASIKMEMAV